MIRLFVALKIPGEVKEALLNTCKRLAVHPENFKWETPEKIHLTLKFIGEVDEELLDPIKEELDFVKNYYSFNCSVTKFDFFFRFNEPKILWAGLKTDDSIYELVNELNNKLKIFSVPVEKRKFKPHLTMLRIKKHPGEKFIQDFRNYRFEDFNFTSNEVALIKSRLLPTGAKYIEIKKYNLT